jgi:putative transposase
MSRAWRIEYAGALYHVLSRGNDRRDIFTEDDDRLLFLDTLGEISDRFAVDICAYVLMSNHYHLLLRTRRANLSKAMQWLGVTYTNRFNPRHGRSGHLFQGRFKSMLVQNDAYLLQLSYYIHRNPLRANLVKRLADYRWSTYRAYAYGKSSPEWLHTKIILSQLKNTEDPHQSYRETAQEYSKEESKLWESLRHGFIIGSRQFVKSIRAWYLPEKPHGEIPQQKSVAKTVDPVTILRKAAKTLGCSLERFKRSGKVSAKEVQRRDMLLYLIWQLGVQTNQEIGELFGLTYSAVSRRVSLFKDALKKDAALRQGLDQLKSKIKT